MAKDKIIYKRGFMAKLIPSFRITLLSALVSALPLSSAVAANNGVDEISLGIEGFHDEYKEDSLGVDNKANYGSVTGSYTHNFNEYFAGADGRLSYGRNDYSSPDGTDSGIPQWEVELRARGGVTVWSDDDASLAAYSGLGLRYFLDEGKGEFTQTAFLYDRRITQIYLPIGIKYKANVFDNWTVSPTLEYDQLLWGNVNSRLLNGGAYNPEYIGANPYNTQTSGYGIRGEFMVGQQVSKVFSWEVGPFVRYWNIKQSDTTTSGAIIGDEPANTRTQIGIALRGNF